MFAFLFFILGAGICHYVEKKRGVDAAIFATLMFLIITGTFIVMFEKPL